MHALIAGITIVSMLALVLLLSFLRFSLKPKNDVQQTIERMQRLRQKAQQDMADWQKRKQDAGYK